MRPSKTSADDRLTFGSFLGYATIIVSLACVAVLLSLTNNMMLGAVLGAVIAGCVAGFVRFRLSRGLRFNPVAWALLGYAVLLVFFLALIDGLLSRANDLVLGLAVGAAVASTVVSFARIRRPLKDFAAQKTADERFRLLFDCSSDPHLLFDETGILECNQAAVDLLGYTSKYELRQLRPADLSPEFQPDGRRSRELVEEIGRFVEERGSYRFEWIHKKADGSTFPVEVTITSLELDGKRVSLCLWRDLSEQRRTKADLLKSQQKMQLHFEQTPLAVIEWDTEFRVTAWNPAAERMFGWTRDEMLGKEGLSIVPEAKKGETAALWKSLIADRGGRRTSNDNLTKSGRTIRCEWYNTVLVDSEHRVIGVASLVEDVTESKQAQEALAQAAFELENRNRQLAQARDDALQSTKAKSEFLANMSHEIRTPMNGVIGMTGLLLETPLNDQQRDYVQTIRSSGDALLTVINDILDFSKIESGKMTIENADFSLREVMEEVGDLLGAKAHEKGIELINSLPKGFPEYLKGDAGRIRQVITNLAANAIKFTDEGEVAIGAAVVKTLKRKVAFRVSVRDTGIGVPAHRQQAIFESFTQVDGSTTRRYGGTGLGLTISRQLVQLMGGRIGVISEEGKGSEFWFELTLEPQVDVKQPANPLESELFGMHVLAVDDNATNLRVLREQLRSWGCLVSEARSGAEAIGLLAETAKNDPVGLIVMDMQMPGMDGDQTTAAIRSEPKFAAIPIVLLSSIGNVDQETARAKGYAAALNKPVRQSQLYGTLVSVVGPESEWKHEEELVPHLSVGSPLKGLRVLLAEDNVVNQKVALRVLEKFGATADYVANGKEAVDAVQAAPYDVVLMDCQMPEMDGYEATRAIRQEEIGEGRRMPIIAMTANAMKGDREKCLEAGMDDYLAKPIKPAEVLAAILKWTLNSRAA